MRTTPILVEDYLRRKCLNQTDHIWTRSSIHPEHFAMLNQNEHFCNNETKGEDISHKTVLQPQHGNTDQTGDMMQSGSSQKS